MEHSIDRVRELARQVMHGNAATWPTILLLPLDYLAGDGLREVFGYFEATEDGVAHWYIVGCTEAALVAVEGDIDQAGKLIEGSLRTSMRKLSDLRSVALTDVVVADRFNDIDSRASWRFEFATGEPLELSTIDVRESHIRNQIETVVALILRLAGMRTTPDDLDDE